MAFGHEKLDVYREETEAYRTNQIDPAPDPDPERQP